MCFIALALTAAATAVSVIGQVQASKAAQSRSEYEASLARGNVTRSEVAAKDALARGKRRSKDSISRGRLDTQLSKREFAQFIGIQRASAAGAGVQVNTGTARRITVDTAGVGKFEEQLIVANAAREAQGIEINAEREAYAFRTQGAAFAAEEELLKRDARSRRRALPFALAGTVLAGGAKAFGQASTFQNTIEG